MGERAGFELAVRRRESGAPVGEVFAFISGLYFRGKLAYASAFGTSWVITADRGLMRPETLVSISDLQEIAAVPIDLAEIRYRQPLERDALELNKTASEVVLLGSLATPKYLEPLRDIFGSGLLFPSEFVGRGDLSRGGLLLRSVREGKELDYICALKAPESI
jgi:hypothetical protein